MQNDLQLLNTVLENATYTLDNFYTSTVQEKQELLSRIHKNVQCVVIVSEVGMGGTHLLAGIYKELKDEAASIDYEKLLNKHKKEGITSLNLQGYKYLFLNDWHAFYNKCEAYLSLVEFIENEIEQFVCNGGKVFMKINPLETTDMLETYIMFFSTHKIKLDKVELPILKKMLEGMFQQICVKLTNKIEDQLLGAEYSSYRHFQSSCIVWMASHKVERIENKNLD